MSFIPNNAFFNCPSWGSFWVASLIAGIISAMCYNFGTTSGNESIGKFGAAMCGLLLFAYWIFWIYKFVTFPKECHYSKFPDDRGMNPFASVAPRTPGE